MSARDDGGPAFPVAADGAYIPDCDDPGAPPDREYPGHPGMTLRDWFAGQALMGIIAKSPYKSGTLAEMKESGDIAARAAAAYDYADAMLKEREK